MSYACLLTDLTKQFHMWENLLKLYNQNINILSELTLINFLASQLKNKSNSSFRLNMYATGVKKKYHYSSRWNSATYRLLSYDASKKNLFLFFFTESYFKDSWKSEEKSFCMNKYEIIPSGVNPCFFILAFRCFIYIRLICMGREIT